MTYHLRTAPTTSFMDRRAMIKTSTVAGLGMVGGMAFTAPACGAKSLSGWVASIDATFDEMKPLLPELGLSAAIVAKVSELIDKGGKILRDFAKVYEEGKFANAVVLFSSLGGIVSQIAADLNLVGNRIIKLALVGIAVARIAIASLLDSQSGDPKVAETVASNAANPAVLEIKRLAAMDISRLVLAVQ